MTYKNNRGDTCGYITGNYNLKLFIVHSVYSLIYYTIEPV